MTATYVSTEACGTRETMACCLPKSKGIPAVLSKSVRPCFFSRWKLTRAHSRIYHSLATAACLRPIGGLAQQGRTLPLVVPLLVFARPATSSIEGLGGRASDLVLGLVHSTFQGALGSTLPTTLALDEQLTSSRAKSKLVTSCRPHKGH